MEKGVSFIPNRKVSPYKARAFLTNVLFMLPAFLLFVYVVLIPFVQSIPYSFANQKNIMSDTEDFVGLKNYKLMLTSSYFRDAFFHTIEFIAYYLVGANLLGLFLALMFYRPSRFANFMRTMLLLPFTVALTSAVIVWSYVYTDVYSLIFGVMSPLGDSDRVVAGMSIIAIWRDMGYCMLIYIAALQSIPLDCYEASKVEGAGWFRQLHYVAIPMMVPAFTSNVTLSLVWGLKCFDYPMAVARNMEAAQTTVMFVYDYIFGFSKTGLGQTAAIILTVVLIVLTRFATTIFQKPEVEA